MRTRTFRIYQAATVELRAEIAEQMIHLHLTTGDDEPVVISLSPHQVERLERHITVLRQRAPSLFGR